MKLNFVLNGTPRQVYTEQGENVRQLLYRIGINSVRNSDDGYAFAGSDSILLDGKIVSSSLLIAAQIQGSQIKTVESLSKQGMLSPVQSAMVDAGIVQSAYNIPAAALILTELLDRISEPTKEEIKDAMSAVFIRDSGYEQFYNAVALAIKRTKDPDYKNTLPPEFRDDLKFIGKVKRKVDGAKLVRGERVFVEDRREEGSAVLKMLRSPHASAYIKSIDIAQAQKIPGVVTILTHENTPDVWYTQAGQGFPEPSPYDRRLFGEKMNHVGDRVAAVVADNYEIADLALSKIKVEYEVLKHVMTIDEAQAPGAPLIHDGEIFYRVGAPHDLAEKNKKFDPRDGKIIYPFPIGGDPRKNIAASVSGGIGDMGKGFSDADVIMEREYRPESHIQCTPLETHTVYTKMDGDRLIMHCSTQVPFHVRRITASILGISENKIRVIKERVGGGYGSKQDILLEEVCAFATHSTGRSIFHQYSRKEEFESCSTRKPMKIRVKLGAKKDGKLTAVYMDVKANAGPYGAHALTVPMNACAKSMPLFLCDNFGFDVAVYYSNASPTGAYQGYGAPKGSYALQMAAAELAEKLGMDPLNFLELNRVHEGSMLEILKCLGEGREGVAVPAESCGLGTALKEGAKMIHWGKKEVSNDPDVEIGKGVVIIQQGSGLPGLDQSNAMIKMLGDGTFMLFSGGADLGTGLDTVCVKMASETLQTEMDNVSILSGDTDNTPFDTGAYASSGTYFSGSAALLAARDIKDKILKTASKILDEPLEDLRIQYPGKVVGKKDELTYAKLAWHTQAGEGQGQLIGLGHFTTDKAAFPYGAHFVQVAVNKRTGAIKVQKYYALQDAGMPINPELAQGQIFGGVLKSIGHTLYEGLVYDSDGSAINTDLRSYGVPMIGDVPEDFQVKLIYTDDPYGPYGAKSISEIATNGAAPVIANAIHDAIGIWMRKWPFSPEAVLRELGKIG
ncbi:MAG: molybdopterin-dependent oxidoreductase Mo/Fe-S-binding subunit [Deltaproteobacteria bacterium]|uniref:molybdopterin-dependent oxidoreductase Mo/Fe-S-binding subunit n=1 Tax=Desulfobacula sp. TaxID=2593537 RepID=UPI0019A533AB|nr:molybdopterin-dependent oxidoreductase Mo/Fe-S-binding subunit [Candidatus Desulfobacula maris]MBL6993884.1 molybdopterin-dependent oxidoreductase Mo/Fe-S-binding subunit [Desulfobacula sp.]